jgi:hypothetical protein
MKVNDNYFGLYPGSVKAKNYSWSAAKFEFEFHAKNFKIHKKRNIVEEFLVFLIQIGKKSLIMLQYYLSNKNDSSKDEV